MNRSDVPLCTVICLSLTLFLSTLIRTPHLSALKGTTVLDPNTLSASGRNNTAVARLLNIYQRTFYQKLAKYNL